MCSRTFSLLLASVCVAEHLLGCSFEQSLAHLKSLQSSISADQLVEQSLLVSLDFAECERVELEFEREQAAARLQQLAASDMHVANQRSADDEWSSDHAQHDEPSLSLDGAGDMDD